MVDHIFDWENSLSCVVDKKNVVQDAFLKSIFDTGDVDLLQHPCKILLYKTHDKYLRNGQFIWNFNLSNPFETVGMLPCLRLVSRKQQFLEYY